MEQKDIRFLKKDFISLVRYGIGHFADSLSYSNWEDMRSFAAKQGLTAILIDAIDKLPVNTRPPKDMILECIGESLHNYECRYEQYKRTIADLACFFNSHHIKM